MVRVVRGDEECGLMGCGAWSCVDAMRCDAMRWVAVKLTKDEKISNTKYTK